LSKQIPSRGKTRIICGKNIPFIDYHAASRGVTNFASLCLRAENFFIM